MIFPEEMKRVATCLAAEGLSTRLLEANDPDLEDDQIEIFRHNKEGRVVIQIARGGYHVREYWGDGETSKMAARGSFLSLRKAIDRTIDIVNDQFQRKAI